VFDPAAPPDLLSELLVSDEANKRAVSVQVVQRWTRRTGHWRPATHVGVTDALRTCRDILEGRYDDIPESSFYFAGGIEDIRKRHGTDE
jgi:F0F1-type ATP synthase beta subunit